MRFVPGPAWGVREGGMGAYLDHFDPSGVSCGVGFVRCSGGFVRSLSSRLFGCSRHWGRGQDQLDREE